MRLKRIYAANIREGMRRVREELGADAVILSNRRIEDGIEIVAAIDYDERAYAGLQQAAAAAEAVPAAAACATISRQAASSLAASARRWARSGGNSGVSQGTVSSQGVWQCSIPARKPASGPEKSVCASGHTGAPKVR